MNIIPAVVPALVPEDEVPSSFTHNTYQFSNEDGSGYDNNQMVKVATTNKPSPRAQCVGSGIAGTEGATVISSKFQIRKLGQTEYGDHTVMLDLDIPATLVPSSTPGHSHLYIDLPIPWEKYKNLLAALYDAGIIEKGFYDSAIKNNQTFLRMPGIMKKKGAIPA